MIELMETERAFERSIFGLESRWLDLANGERVHYHDEGSGPVILFLHGSGVGVSAAQNWWQTIPALAGFRRIAYDLSGFGHTQPPHGAAIGVPDWIGQIERVLDGLAIERAILVGNSLGGLIALHAGIVYPSRVAGIVTIGAPALNITNHSETPSARLATDAVTPASIENALRRMVHAQTVVTPEIVEARYRMAIAAGAPERFSRVIEARGSSIGENPLDRAALAALPMPVLIGHGREDRIVPSSVALELATIIPFADLHLLANAGHWPQNERSDAFNRLVQQFAETVYA
jgi:2-hydroxymuconate-semialdehyde hydrolase